MILQQYIDRIKEVHGKNLVEPSQTLLSEAAAAFEGALRGFWTEQKARFPRPSSMGYKARRLWLMKRNPEVKGDFAWQSSIVGNALETVLIYLLKEVGAPISDVQARVSGKMEGYEVAGSIDFKLMYPDGKKRIVDVKTCSDFSWTDNFGSAEKFAAKNPYGYLTQAAVYEYLSGEQFGGWLVMNKSSGEVKFLDADYMRAEIAQALDEVQDALRQTYQDDMPLQCFPVMLEEFKGEKTGNIKVDYECAKCPFVKTCFPDAKKAKRGPTTLYYLGEPKIKIAGIKFVDENEQDEE